MAAAVVHHQAGRLSEAEAGYRAVLQRAPSHPACLHFLGMLAIQHGRAEEGVDLIGRAIALTTQSPVAQFHNNIAAALRSLNRLDEAANHCARAVALEPNYARAHYSLGEIRQQQGMLPQAVTSYDAALRYEPNNVAARKALAKCLKNLGRFADAARHYERVLSAEPGNAEMHNDMGVVLQEQGALVRAIAHYRQATVLKPDFMVGHFNLGVALKKCDQLDEAAAHYARALALEPKFAQAHFNLGIVLAEQGKLAEALTHYRRSLELLPNQPDVHWNEALALLLSGDLRAGFAKYYWRWHRNGLSPRRFIEPAWDGRDLNGQSILLYAEQGFGDTIQFLRYAAMVKARGGHVIVEVQPGLEHLAQTVPGVDEVVPVGGTLPPFTCHAALLELPRLFDTTLETIPAMAPYLTVDAARVQAWRTRLNEGLHVGLVWRGSPTNGNDHRRSMSAATMAKIAAPSGITFVNLLHNAREEELDFLARAGSIRNFGAEITDWAETAALVASLDLVVTVDTAMSHLAGALGKPVWVMLPFAPDWRWMLRRDDTPWYPTMRLFRQQTPGDWGGVMAAISHALVQQALT